MGTIEKAVLITFCVGILIIYFDWSKKRKQKGGLTAADKKSLVGLFWLTLGACGLVAFGIWGLA
jgi:hypothetical protein